MSLHILSLNIRERRTRQSKMKYLQFTFVVFIAFACFVEYGTSTVTNCYQCNSLMESRCNDAFDKSALSATPCPTNYTMCRKIVQEVYYEKEWNTRVIRECAQAGSASSDCSDRTGTYKLKVKYCQCSGEGCNSASNIKLSIAAVVLPLIAVCLTVFKKL